MPKRKEIELDYDSMGLRELERLLTMKQRKFVLGLVSGIGNQTNAAIAAGYSPKTAASQATENLKKPKVAAYRRALTCAVLERACLTPASISLKLLEIFERCMEAIPVLEWDAALKEHVPTGEYQFNARGAIKVMELLGKNAGMFKDKVEHSGAATLSINLPAEIEGAGI